MSLSEYDFHDKVILRTPLYPLAKKDVDFNAIIADSQFIQALSLASPDLSAKVDRLQHGQLPDKKEQRRVKLAVRKYWNRFCTRTVPFGTFASTGVVAWEKEDSANNPIIRGDVQARSRLDMHFLYDFAVYLESLDEVKEILQYYPNGTLHRLGEEYRYLESANPKKRSSYKVSATPATTYLDTILTKAEQGKTISDLIKVLQEVVPGISKEEVKTYIEELIKNQVLVSELEPTVTGREYQAVLLDFLSKKADQVGSKTLRAYHKKYHAILSQLNNASEEFDQQLFIFKRIQSELSDLGFEVPLSRLVQTDTFHSYSGHLNRRVQNTLKNGIKAWLAFSSPSRNENLIDFCKRFRERYDQEMVPLFEVLDPETGLGYPNSVPADISELTDDFVFRESKRINTTWDDRERWYLKKLLWAHRNGKYAISLNDQDLKDFHPPTQNMAPSLSVMFRVVDHEKGSVELQSAWGSSAVNILGRFAHGSKGINELTQEIALKEQQVNKDVVFAEIVHLPESRVGNVLQRPTTRPYEISFLAKSSVGKDFEITLDDLWVKVTGNSVELWSEKLKKRIIPRLGTAHNYRRSYLPAYKFLCDLQLQDVLSVSAFNWGSISSQFQFLPRVEYRNAIIHTATWNLKREDIEELLEVNSGETLLSNVAAFRRQWNLPEHVLYAEGDNELLIDLSKEHDIQMWLDAARNRNKITLKEFLWSDAAGVKDQKGGLHRNQYVASLVTEKSRYRSRDSFKSREKGVPQRVFLPGSEWLYYKIYCGERLSDQVLSAHIWPYLKGLLDEGTIDQFFFIRYQENGHHIRVRVHSSDTNKIPEIVSGFTNQLSYLQKINICWKSEIGTYHREIERYGTSTMELAEKIFFHDSVAAMELLSSISGDIGEELRWQWLMRLIYDLLELLDFSLQQRFDLCELNRQRFFEEFGGSKELKLKVDKSFRKNQNIIKRVLEESFQPEIDSLNKILTKRKQDILGICQEVKTRLAHDLSLSLENFASSIIHMEVNRTLASRQRFYEFLIYTFLSKHYKSEMARAKQP